MPKPRYKRVNFDECTHVAVKVVDEDRGVIHHEYEDSLGDLKSWGYETWGEVYNSYQKEYGRCTSPIFNEIGGETIQVGWYFSKIETYDDTHKNFTRGAWVTLMKRTPEKWGYPV